jgi:hypothetical protein
MEKYGPAKFGELLGELLAGYDPAASALSQSELLCDDCGPTSPKRTTAGVHALAVATALIRAVEAADKKSTAWAAYLSADLLVAQDSSPLALGISPARGNDLGDVMNLLDAEDSAAENLDHTRSQADDAATNLQDAEQTAKAARNALVAAVERFVEAVGL